MSNDSLANRQQSLELRPRSAGRRPFVHGLRRAARLRQSILKPSLRGEAGSARPAGRTDQRAAGADQVGAGW